MAEFVQTTLMDGYAGGPHITEAQLGLAHQATFGPDDYVLEGGRESEAQVLTNNSIRIFDAVYCIQGRRDVIPASGYTDVTIDNGTQGMNRNDIIVRRYKKDEVSEEESTEYAVIKGTPSSGEAVDPSVTTGNIRSGAVLHEMKLYRVKLTGLNIVEVEPLFNILKNQATLQKEIAQSNKDLSNKLTELNGNKPSFFHHELLWSGKLASKKTATGMSPNWSKYTLFVCRFDGGVSMALGIRCKDDSSSGWKDWIRFIGGNDSGSATDVYVASVMISGDTITSAGVGSHALTSTGCPGVDRIMCEIYGII